MDIACTNITTVGFAEELWEPDTVNTGTYVGVVHRGADCIAFSYSTDLEILEIEIDEASLTFVGEDIPPRQEAR